MARSRSRLRWVLTLAFLAGTPAAHAQWAVVDVGAIAQLVQEVQVMGQTLQTAQNTLNQVEQQYRAITGDRGMENLLAGTNRNYLPTSTSDLSSVLAGTSVTYSALASQVQQSVNANAILAPTTVAGLSADEQREVTAGRQIAALLQTLSGQALTTTSSRFSTLQQLISAIPTATDAKGALDLQARIGAEQTMLANDESKLGALYQLAQGAEWAREEREREQAITDLGSMRNLAPLGL